MTYNAVLDWMFQQLPMYQNKGKSAYKEDLTNALILDNYLGSPHKSFRSIHVAGTNGKGSTSHMLASVLQEAGYKVGLYTSPHLRDFRERIKINGEPINEDEVISFIKKHKPFLESHHFSFFEMTVGMAFDYFSKQKIDVAIIEVGLGGRLDSTNIITPILSVITNIGYDHMAILGDTLGQIATEKAGIIKPGIPVVIGETQSETSTVFRLKATTSEAPIVFAEDLELKGYISDLKGDYQKRNILTVTAALGVLSALGLKLSDSIIENGLLNVNKNTGLLGRWQILSLNPKIICDTAHNKEGLSLVMQQLSQEEYSNLHVVFGAVKDKNLSEIFDILPRDAHYYLCQAKIERAFDVKKLSEAFHNEGLKYTSYVSVNDAFDKARLNASKDDVIFIGGSTFVVAEVL